MTLYKKSEIDPHVIVSSSVYLCSCGHTEMTKEILEDDKVCKECGEKMSVISSSTEELEDEPSEKKDED